MYISKHACIYIYIYIYIHILKTSRGETKTARGAGVISSAIGWFGLPTLAVPFRV